MKLVTSPRNRRHARKILVGAALLAVVAWVAPSFISAERYRRRLEAGLEQALKRPVAFGAVSFRLLPRPGFAIEKVLIREDPQFGLESFAHVERIDADLRWRSLLRSRLEFARLHLDHPTFNAVRNAQGEWNFERLLRQSGIASPATSSPGSRHPESLALEVEGARIDFQIGDLKKPFTITDLRAQLNFDPARGLLRYRLTGRPIRTDLVLPSPGELQLEGDWTPGRSLDGPLNATLRTEKSLLYDWVPLMSGRDWGIYGVMDVTARLAGSVRAITAEGDCTVRQLYRWALPPPSDSTSVRISFRAGLDRALGRAVIDSADVAFAGAQLHLTGSVTGLFAQPDLNLALVIAPSRLDDLFALGRHFSTSPKWLDASGKVDGLVAIRGPWANRRYGGLVTVREAEISTPSGKLSASDAVLRVDDQGVRLAPIKLTVAPHVELVAEGRAGLAMPTSDDEKLRNSRNEPGKSFRINKAVSAKGARQGDSDGTEPDSPRYEITLSAKSVPLPDLVRFSRSWGLRGIEGVEARDGTASGIFHLGGPAWPPKSAGLEGRIEVDRARLLLPGLSEALGVPRAVFEVAGSHITASPVIATLGDSRFSGRVEGDWGAQRPWTFDLSADRLTLEQGALWFEVLGHRSAPPSILDLLPGLRAFDTRRAAASSLFAALEAKGVFHASAITYRTLAVSNTRATVEVLGRVVRISDATFRAAGGRGRANIEVNLTALPARTSVQVTLADSSLEALEPWLPASLRKLRGTVSGSGKFATRGLTRQEAGAHLEGEGTLALKGVSFGDFDPLDALAEQCHWGTLEPPRRREALRSATLTVRVRDRHVMLQSGSVEMAGARLEMSGNYSFDGRLDIAVQSDLTHLTRRWQAPVTYAASHVSGSPSLDGGDEELVGSVHLAGPLDRLQVVPGASETRLDQPKD